MGVAVTVNGLGVAMTEEVDFQGHQLGTGGVWSLGVCQMPMLPSCLPFLLLHHHHESLDWNAGGLKEGFCKLKVSS